MAGFGRSRLFIAVVLAVSLAFCLRSDRRCAALYSHLRARAFRRFIVASDELALRVMWGEPLGRAETVTEG